MSFSPDTEVWLFKDTAVSVTDQPYFDDEQTKISWYMTHSHSRFTAQSYQREMRQYFRAGISAAEVRGCDMLAFRNAATDRWIICRITGTEFVNPGTTDIYFETDAMQTWIDVINWRMCWVEREMVDGDWNGDLPGWQSLTIEGINPGTPYSELIHDGSKDDGLSSWEIHVLSAYDSNADENYNTVNFGGYVTGVNDIILTDTGQLDSLLEAYAKKGKLEGIVGVWVYPTRFRYSAGYSLTSINFPTEIAGYKPKNSKCFSSEFCKFEVANRVGDSIEYAPEFVNYGPSGVFTIYMSGGFLNGAGGIRCGISNYMGSEFPVDFSVVLPADIQCAYIGNSFANWLSQNKVGIAAGIVSSLAGLVSGGIGLAENPSGTGALNLIGGLTSTAATISNITSKMAHPAGVYGQSSALGLLAATGTFGYTLYLKSPGQDVIKTIDNFFDVYGYKVCKVKVPNVKTRPFWNYVKCAPAIVAGPMSSKDRAEIESMLNNGVTFWHVTNGTLIGDYTHDNRER